MTTPRTVVIYWTLGLGLLAGCNDPHMVGLGGIWDMEMRILEPETERILGVGICGVGAAVANAIYNATGVRVREYPITLDKLIGKLPGAA